MSVKKKTRAVVLPTTWAKLGEVRWRTPDGVVHRAYAPREFGPFCSLVVWKALDKSNAFQGRAGEVVHMDVSVTCPGCRKFSPAGWDSVGIVDMRAIECMTKAQRDEFIRTYFPNASRKRGRADR